MLMISFQLVPAQARRILRALRSELLCRSWIVDDKRCPEKNRELALSPILGACKACVSQHRMHTDLTGWFSRCAAWEAKKQRRLSTAIQRRNIREKIFESEPTNPAVASASEELTAAETSFREALSEELEGLAIESDSLQG